MASATRGGPGIAPGKHPTAIRVFQETTEVLCNRCGMALDFKPQDYETDAEIARHMDNDAFWYVCKPCLDAMPNVPPGIFGTATDQDGNETDVQIGG